MSAQIPTINLGNKLLTSADIQFDLQIPSKFETGIEKKLGNGFRPKLTDALSELSQSAKENQITPVFETSKNALTVLHSADSVSLRNVNQIVKASLNSVAAVIPYEEIEILDEKAIKVIDVIDRIFPNEDEIKIAWDIFINSSSPFIMPFENFLNRFRESLQNPGIRNKVVSSYKEDSLEAGKILLWALKALFWYRGQLVEEWRDVDSDLFVNKDAAKHALKAVKAKKWFVLNFELEKAESMLKWIDQLHLMAAQKGFHFVKVAVLADYRLIRTPHRPIWRGKFGDAGAIFERFPDGINTFLEAIKLYDEQLVSSAKYFKERREERKKQTAAA